MLVNLVKCGIKSKPLRFAFLQCSVRALYLKQIELIPAKINK